MKCSKCGADLEEGVLFCRECGTRVDAPQKRFCRECGAALTGSAKFCTECGAKIEIPTIVPQEFIMQEPDDNELTDDINVNSIIDEVYEESASVQEQEKVKTSKKKSTKEATPSKKKKPTPPKPPNKKKGCAGFILVVLVFFVLFIAGIAILGNSGVVRSANTSPSEQNITVPNVTNMAYPAALNVLRDAGFTNISSNVEPNTDESIWYVTDQSVKAGKRIKAGEKIDLTCGRRVNLYIDVKSEYNIILATYDISITLDDIEIGTVANGKEFTCLKEVVTGEHTLVFCKSGSTSPKATKKFLVSSDMTYACELAHSGSSIEIKNESRSDNVGGASLEVVDVTGMVLSDANAKLKTIGFSNVRAEPNSNIWNSKNWIVVSQGLSPGSIVDKNEFFQLDCVSLDDYFSNAFVGKYGGTEKTAVVTINNPNEVPVSPTPTPSKTPSSSQEEKEIITKENDPEFADLLNAEYVDPDKQAAFVKKHRGDIVEFDCIVGVVMPNPKYNTIYDYILVPGESLDTGIGAVMFYLEDAGIGTFHWDSKTRPSYLEYGSKLTMRAKIVSGDDPLYIYLQPVKTWGR